MKGKLFVHLSAMVLIAFLPLWASDGAAAYKKKCAHCHGPGGEGKAAMKAPALKGTSLEASQIADRITKGESGSKAPHNKGMAGLNDEQAKAIADYVKMLK